MLRRVAEQVMKTRSDAEEVSFCLVNALSLAGLHDDALSMIDKLEEGRVYPVGSAQRDRLVILARAGRFAALEALGKEILERDSTSSLGWEMLSQAAWRRGDLRGYRAIDLDMANAGVRVDASLNDGAWAGVLLGAEEEDVRLAERAVAAMPRDEAFLGTLAVVLAETGEVNRAARTVEHLVRLRGTRGSIPSMIFARARIAEVLGFSDAARELYGKVPSASGIDDLAPLARKRQAALEASGSVRR